MNRAPHLPFAVLTILVFTPPVADGQDRVLFEFTNPSTVNAWQAVNDGVMGGRSVGGFQNGKDNQMVFFGTLSLENNGGFASIRARGGNLSVNPNEFIIARVRGDGREYKFNLYTRNDLGGYSYRQSFQTQKGQWIEVAFPIERFVATWRGRTYPNQRLDPRRNSGLGFLLGDKKPGPFQLEIEWIKVSQTPPNSKPKPPFAKSRGTS